MNKNDENINSELKEKNQRLDIQNMFEQSKKSAEEFVRKLVDDENFKFECHHDTHLQYEFENDKESFVELLVDCLYMEFFRGMPTDKDLIINTRSYCSNCGEWLSYKLANNKLTPIEFDKNHKPVDDKRECFKADVFSVEIAVPSGRLVLVDWPVHGKETLSYLDKDEVGNTESINCTKGTFNRSNKYAKENIMHFFVGNTSPSVYLKDNVVYIGSNGYDDEDDEILFMEDAEDVGSVCTDLWWVTAFDYEVYKKLVICKVGEKNKLEETYDKDNYGSVQVNIKPGIYKCTHYYDTLDTESSEPQLYSKMEWIRGI